MFVFFHLTLCLRETTNALTSGVPNNSQRKITSFAEAWRIWSTAWKEDTLRLPVHPDSLWRRIVTNEELGRRQDEEAAAAAYQAQLARNKQARQAAAARLRRTADTANTLSANHPLVDV